MAEWVDATDLKSVILGDVRVRIPLGGPIQRGEIMNRIYLEVPFSEKEQAKQMGAKWDAHHRMWYVPEGKDAGRAGMDVSEMRHAP